MYSTYKLNKQGDSIQPWSTAFLILNQSLVPRLVLTVASGPAYRFFRRQVRWSSTPTSLRIFYSLLWSRQLKGGFPGSSDSKESACNSGDPSSIPGSGRSPGEGIGYSFQYSWASLVTQTVKNLPAMQETWVQYLGWEDPLEKEMASCSSILAWKIPWSEEPGGLQSMGSQRVGHNRVTNTHS